MTAAEPNPLKPLAAKETPHSGPSATVQLRQGRYRGVVLSQSERYPRAIEAWRGISFAQSTGGENRFNPPIPLPLAGHVRSQSDTLFEAERFGPVCYDSEDCLKANVYRQAYTGGDGLLPVVIYVHGGAFNGGLGTERDMASFVSWSEEPMIGVNFNYRLGALGFLSSSLAAKEGLLNLGLKDQQMLFEWVRDNIEAFGGDPHDVTLMGLSAGAHSIGHHLMSYTSKNAPFHKAIMESGGSTARATWAPDIPLNQTQFNEFLSAAGLDPNTPDSAIFPTLRTLPLEQIAAASRAIFDRYQDPVRWPFQPVIDGPSSWSTSTSSSSSSIIQDLPILKFRAGKQLRIPILTGFNTNEGTIFINSRADNNADFLSPFKTMIPALTRQDMSGLNDLYPDPVSRPDVSPYVKVPPGCGRQWARLDAAYAHYAYICPVLQTGHFYSKSKSPTENYKFKDEETDAQIVPPVWVYHFAAKARADWGTANHADNAPVVAHDMAAIGQFPGLVRAADSMHGAWARFITTGNPNPRSISATTKTPYWPKFQSPFSGDTAQAPILLTDQHRDQARIGEMGNGGAGQGQQAASSQRGIVMLFGAGNDERMGSGGQRNPGTPAQVVSLTEYELQQCRFWWERVELSEGIGERLSKTPKARL